MWQMQWDYNGANRVDNFSFLGQSNSLFHSVSLCLCVSSLMSLKMNRLALREKIVKKERLFKIESSAFDLLPRCLNRFFKS